MNFTQPVNAPAIGVAVWQNFSRTLTTLYSTLVYQNSSYISLAALATVSLQPTVTDGWLLSAGLIAGAAGTITSFLFDGTSAALILSVAAGSTGTINGVSLSNAMYLRLNNNDAANVAKYAYCAIALR